MRHHKARRDWTRPVIAILAPALLLGTLVACGTEAPKSPNEPEPAATVQPHPITAAVGHGVAQASDGSDPFIDSLLEDAGYPVERLFLQQSEDLIQAVARGDADIGRANPVALAAAIAAGIPVIGFSGGSGADYALVAPVSVKDPSGLTGMRIGIHTKASTTTLLVNLALKDYPDVKPEILVVPGSANRILAMAEGELDASPLQLGDIAQLEKLAPGKFHVIVNYSERIPDYVDGIFITRTEVLEKDPDLVKAYIRSSMDGAKALYENPEKLAEWYTENMPDVSPERGKELAQTYIDAKVWLTDGGLTPSTTEFTLDALKEADLMPENPVTPEQFVDLTLLNQVLNGE